MFKTAITPDLDIYLKKGETLKNMEAVQKIVKGIENTPENRSFFTEIIRKPMTGKTQLAFSLCHLIKVIYVNFQSIDQNQSDKLEAIHVPFAGISNAFCKVIDFDRKNPEFVQEKNKHPERYPYTVPSQTLGLIFTFLSTRKICEMVGGLKVWLQMIWNFEDPSIPVMSLGQFLSTIAGSGFSLKEFILFVDNAPFDNRSEMAQRIQFLKDTCAAIHLPLIIVKDTN